ncbi:SAV_915 family protein [Streptomyces sp. NRRL B-1347]|uniref:SAV_915 family protein n=1 Tax=Streptomyces sp. NRRL B-1347 TaxID=1476877 RepID=UPI000B13138E|nr:SAV_915 family protein [Streptomyces sp. NRRL B-1347]
MAELLCGEDPEPSDRFPAGLLYVPVRPGPSGYATRLFRTPLGARTAVGFTTERQLAATFGPDHLWIRLAEPALRAMTEPLGAAALTVDPRLTAPAPTREEQPIREEQLSREEHLAPAREEQPAPVRTPCTDAMEPADDDDDDEPWPHGGGHCRWSLSFRLD